MQQNNVHETERIHKIPTKIIKCAVGFHNGFEDNSCTIAANQNNENTKNLSPMGIKTVTGYDYIKPYTCDRCGGIFNKRAFVRHNCSKPYKCDLCRKAFESTEKRSLHVDRVHNITDIDDINLNKCTLCHKVYAQYSSLNRHIKIAHTKVHASNCPKCEKPCDPHYLQSHIQSVHYNKTLPYQCDLCDKTYLRLSQLTRHKRHHSGIKSHNCLLCNKLFWEQSDLEQHLIVHNSEKNFKCNDCNHSYHSNSSLKRHINTQHNVNAKTINCHECQKSFVTEYNLKMHNKVFHLKRFPFNCTNCSQGYTRRARFDEHCAQCNSFT